MCSLSIVVVALLALFVVTVDSFGNLLVTRGARAECRLGARAEKRRKFVETGLTGIGLGFVLGGGAQVANAIGEVADGNSLPDGAKQFSRVLKSQKDVKEIIASLSSSPPTDSSQWKVLSLYIRGLYSLSDDMTFIGKGLAPEKKKMAEEVIKTFKKDVKEADVPAKAEDVEEFKKLMVKAEGGITEFLELLQDIPQDL
ncbi:hypothetical protein TrST_g5726 [Triparma strigata]|uniref:Uncharacterized protein n=1 Tax=Triparma strigata TaxID=1606541 RepID=A0A9W7EDU6_9STRA|nr:hypothetical protein TrST_g5726 [Triparma strigata]